MDKEMKRESLIDVEALEICRFSWSDVLPFKIKTRKKYGSQKSIKQTDENTRQFIHWLLNIFQTYVEELPPNKKWNALSIYMNEKNIEYLFSQIDEMVWLNIGPRCCQELADDEYGADKANILVDKNKYE